MPDLLVTHDGFLIDTTQSGKDFLGEVIVDNLMNEIMSDLYSPSFGTDIKKLPSTNISSPRELELKLVIYLQRVEERIKEEQALYPSSDDNEMLDSLKLRNLERITDINNGISRWRAEIVATTVGGEQIEIEKTVLR